MIEPNVGPAALTLPQYPPGTAANRLPLPSELDAPGAGEPAQPAEQPGADPLLCSHCGRTASNGISCQGFCVADSGY
jgi:hypothetical protein